MQGIDKVTGLGAMSQYDTAKVEMAERDKTMAFANKMGKPKKKIEPGDRIKVQKRGGLGKLEQALKNHTARKNNKYRNSGIDISNEFGDNLGRVASDTIDAFMK